MIHLVPTPNFRPASMHGIPYVAFTRSESFARTAFKNLPPWEDFVKGKKSDMLRMRNSFMEKLNKLHGETLAEHTDMASWDTEKQCWNTGPEAAAHEHWDVQQRQQKSKTGVKKPMERPAVCPACAQAHF